MALFYTKGMNVKIKATLSISNPTNGGVAIRLYDESSRIEFFDGEISHDEFSKALGHLQARPFERAEVRGLAHIGKMRVYEQRKVECPLDRWGVNREELKTWLVENCQEDGWILSTYLGSQGSVEKINGKTFLRYGVTKYVDQETT